MGGTEVALRPEVFGTYTPGSQPFQKRSFPGPIGPGQQHAFTRGQLERDVPDQGAAVVADGEMVDLKHGAGAVR